MSFYILHIRNFEFAILGIFKLDMKVYKYLFLLIGFITAK